MYLTRKGYRRPTAVLLKSSRDVGYGLEQIYIFIICGIIGHRFMISWKHDRDFPDLAAMVQNAQ